MERTFYYIRTNGAVQAICTYGFRILKSLFLWHNSLRPKQNVSGNPTDPVKNSPTLIFFSCFPKIKTRKSKKDPVFFKYRTDKRIPWNITVSVPSIIRSIHAHVQYILFFFFFFSSLEKAEVSAQDIWIFMFYFNYFYKYTLYIISLTVVVFYFHSCETYLHFYRKIPMNYWISVGNDR